MRIDRLRSASLWLALAVVLGFGVQRVRADGRGVDHRPARRPERQRRRPASRHRRPTRPPTLPARRSRTTPATARSRRCPSAPTSSKAGAVRLQDRDHEAVRARGEADRAPRPQAGGQARLEDAGRGRRRRRPSCRRRRRPWARSSLGKTVESLPAQRPQRQPAGPPAAGRDHPQPAAPRPTPRAAAPVPVRTSTATASRRTTSRSTASTSNETIDNRIAYQPSPDALAEISVETNNYAADIGNVAGARDQQRHQVGRATPFHGNVFEFYRNGDFDANTWDEQPRPAPRRSRASSTSSAPPWAAPSSRTSCSSSRDYQGSHPGPARARRRCRWRPDAWRRGDLSSDRAPSIRDPLHRACPSPATRSRSAGSARPRVAILNDSRELPAAEPHRDRRHRQLRGRLAARTTRAHQGDLATRLERLDQRQALPALLVRRATRTKTRQAGRSRCMLPTLERSAASTTSAVNWNQRRSGRRSSTRSSSATTPDHGRQRTTLRLGGHRRTPTPRTASPAASRSPACSLINWGMRPHDASGAVGHGLGHLAEDLPAQREAHLAPRPPRPEVRRPVPALQPAQRFYAGNNGLLGYFNYNGTFTGSAVRGLPARPGVAQGPAAAIRTTRGPTCRIGSDSSSRTTSSSASNLTLNLGLRWAYTSPLVEKDNRQSNIDLQHRRGRPSPTDGSIEDRALYKPYYKGFEPRLGLRLEREQTAWSCAAPTASRSTWKAPGPTCACRSTRRFFFESDVRVRRRRRVRARSRPASPA